MASAVACEDVETENSNKKTTDEPEESDENTNPLLIEVVTRKIFSYMSQWHLESCRTVNVSWNNLATPFIKKVCRSISFNNDNYWTNMKNHGIDDMVRFIDCVNASTNFPFSRLDVGTSVVKEPSHEQILAEFFKVISSWVTEITIRDDWGQRFFNKELPKTSRFPCLEKITIHIIQTSGNDEDVKSNFEFIASIIQAAPALDKIVVVDHNGLDGTVITLFVDLMEKANCRRISNLDIAGQIDDAHLYRLSKMGLALKKLTFDFWGSMIHQDSLKAFLQSQSETLEKFKIIDFAMTSSFEVEFPRMKKLQTLMVQGSVLGRICISFPEISYAKQFPVLKRLSFSNAMDEWDEFLKHGIQPVDTVEELKLPGDFSDEVSLMHAARLFPKIKQLEVSALVNMVNIVYETMPNLEELILNTKYVDSIDEIITGLTAMECEEIRLFSDRMFKRLEDDHMNIITTKPISCLSKLKILRLKCKRRSDPVELTDVSCRLVLLKLQTLECLDFWGRHPPERRISEKVLLAMKKKFLVLC